jgi:hypothetical protein
MDTTRRSFIAGTFATLATGVPAAAQDDAATRSVVRQLREQGFDVTEVRRTLLGRVRVVARRDDLVRELVFDPRNGAILRDYTSAAGGEPSIGPSPRDDRTSDSDASSRDDDDDDGGPSGTSENGAAGDDDDDDAADGDSGGGSSNDDDDDDDDDDGSDEDDSDDGDEDDDDDDDDD